MCWKSNVTYLNIIVKNNKMINCMASFSHLNSDYFITFLYDYCHTPDSHSEIFCLWMCGANSISQPFLTMSLKSNVLETKAYRNEPNLYCTKMLSAEHFSTYKSFTEYYRTMAHSLTPSKLETQSFYRLWCLLPT